MDSNKDIANYITCKMNLGYEESEKLKNIILIALGDYEIKRKEKHLIKYEGNETEYLVKKFLVTKKVEGCSNRTLHAYGITILKVLRKINKPIKEITGDDIVLYLANRDINDHISKITQDNELRYLRTFFTFLMSEEYITRNPCLKVKAIKAIKKKKKAFTQFEVEQIRGACKNYREHAIVETLLSTGCRADELANIKISNIEEDKITILGKGNKERIVYLNAKAQLAITKYLDERNDDNPYLFAGMLSVTQYNPMLDYRKPDCVTKSNHIHRETINDIVKTIAKRVDIKAHTHKFRRTFATMSLRRGMLLIQVSKLLGHASVATTQIYLDISDDELEQAHKKYVI